MMKSEEEIREMEMFEEEDSSKFLVGFNPDVPWSLWRTRLGVMASHNPMDAMKYYFVPHTTGVSLAYLLAGCCLFSIYMAFVWVRWLDADTFNSTSRHAYSPDLELDSSLLPIPTVGFALQSEGVNGSAVFFNDESLVVQEWYWCDHEDAFTSKATTTCTDLPTQQCTINTGATGDNAYTCARGSKKTNALRGSRSTKAKRVLHFRMRRCDNDTDWERLQKSCNDSTTAMDAAFYSRQVTYAALTVQRHLRLPGDNVARLYQTGRVPPRSGRAAVSNFEYEVVTVHELPRWMVDFDKETYAAYSSVLHSGWKFDPANQTESSNGGVYYHATFTLKEEQRAVHSRYTSILQLFSEAFALAAVIYFVGYFIRVYNHWHFLTFCTPELARLPVRYVDWVLDPHVPLQTPGFRDLLKLRRNSARGVWIRDISRLHHRVGKVRDMFEDVITQND